LKSRGVILCVIAGVLLSGCGKFSSSNGSATPTTAPGEIGAGLTVSTTAGPAATTTTARAASGSAPGAAACPHSQSSSDITYANAVRVQLHVAALCPAHADDIALTMTVTNTSSALIHYDPNQEVIFSITAPRGQNKPRWQDNYCATPAADTHKPALNLAAGQSVTFTSLYPGPTATANRETCRKLEIGDYEANALFLVCGQTSYQDGYCSTSEDTQYAAQAIPLTVGA
jgi:hypothetical protein